MKQIFHQNKIKVFDLAKLDNPKSSLMFDFNCANCLYNATCLQSKEDRKKCYVNDEITNAIKDCKFSITIKTDSTKVIVNTGAETDDICNDLQEIETGYTDPEIMRIYVPRSSIIPTIIKEQKIK